MKATQEEIRIGGLAIRFLIEGSASAGSVAMFEFDVAAGAKVPAAHSHDGYEETLYGLAGTLTLTVEGRRTELGPGDVLCIPRGAIHRFDNFHSEDSTVLAVITPASWGQPTSARWLPSSKQPLAAHPTPQPSPPSCAVTASPPHGSCFTHSTSRTGHRIPERRMLRPQPKHSHFGNTSKNKS